MLALTVDPLPPLAAFNVAGEVFVTSNICTHNIAMLTDGYFEGNIVECPMHGGCFNVKTGEATEFPCEEPLKTYPVAIDGEDVLVEIED